MDILNNFLEYQQVVLLQPTSPLRTTLDIDKCIELSVYNKGVPCIAVTNLVNDFSVLVNKDKNNIISQFTVKNDNLYKINGAVYTSASDSFKNNRTFMTKNTICYEMPKERSIDIDTILDFKIAEELFKIEQLNNVD